MTAFIRKLTFSSTDLGTDAALLFTFDDLESNPRLFGDQFPICWRITTFGGKDYHSVQLTYKNQLAFTRPQVDSGKIIGASTFKDINTRQTTTLTVNNGVANFSTPKEDKSLEDGLLRAVNQTKDYADIAIGFHNPGENEPTPALYFKDVGDESNVTAQFTPVLRLYITAGYQETAIIKGAIQSPVIWFQNLAQLKDENTSYVLRRDTEGHWKVT